MSHWRLVGNAGCSYVRSHWIFFGCRWPGLFTATLGAVLLDRLGATAFAVSAATLTGAVLAARYVLDSLAAPWLGGLSDRYGVRTIVVVFMSLGGVALLFAASVYNVYVVSVLIIVFFATGTALQAGVTGAVSQLGAGPFRHYITTMDFGAAVGPLLGWWLLDTSGLMLQQLLWAVVSTWCSLSW
ncbi:MAG: hypothetical protein CM1200mP9_09180 [Gammaproteobacteria bacterium]|nr:MAG: hypothetical protein CM1200mP9_09180 [Gammaproteobacteria bacterium]